MSATERARALGEQCAAIKSQQEHLLGQLQSVLADATQGRSASISMHVNLSFDIESHVDALSALAQARDYVARLKACAELVRGLERQIRPATNALQLQDWQEVEQLVEVARGAAGSFAECTTQLSALGGSAGDAGHGIPPQLRAMELQLAERLHAAHKALRSALSGQMRHCLEQCGWPPPLMPSQSGFDASQLFGAAHDAPVRALQRLALALTTLQMAVEPGVTAAAAAAVTPGSGGEAPLLWVAAELAAPLHEQLAATFATCEPGSPGALDTPELLLGTVQRLAAEYAARVDFLQAVLQALQLHGAYHVSVEFTRALREAVKQVLREHKLPEVAAAGSRPLWLTWIDALVSFEACLARSGLLGCAWEAGDAPDLPAVLLRGSTLAVLGEEAAWMDTWLAAEADAATEQVDQLLYSEEGWGPGRTLLVNEGQPAWQAELWPPRAAEELCCLVQSLLGRLPFIPQPSAQQRYLEGTVGAVLRAAHGRVLRLLQQAEMFRDVSRCDWLPRVCTCICFCHYVEQQLHDMHDDAQVIVTRLLDVQQPQQQQQQQQAQQQQQQQLPANNGGHWPEVQQQHAPQGADDSALPAPSPQQQQQQQQPDASAASAAAKLRLLARPIDDFGSCRREWVLHLGKAAATGFVHQARAYIARGGVFRASTDDLPSLAAGGALWSAGVVSAELQPALAWLAALLDTMAQQLDRACFRTAWGAAAAAINRELFNNVACEAVFNDAGALQLAVDVHALCSVFGRFTPRPAAHFRELHDAVRLLTLARGQADVVRQAVASASRAPNAVDVLKSVGVHHLEPELAETVMSLRAYE